MKDIIIYILEDEKIIALDYISMLKRNGFNRVYDFVDGEDLYKAALEEMPHLVIADLILKNKHDGIHLVERLWERYNVPVIFISGLNLAELKSKYDHLKTRFFDKPVKETELISAVTTLLKTSS
jgi:FixJ family two-component response regulator